MVIDGRALAQEVIQEIKVDLENLKKKGITPKIAIVTVGPEGAWMTYVRQKIKFAQNNGLEHEFIHFAEPDEKKLLATIEQLNNDNNVHGIIIQRPAPGIDRTKIVTLIDPAKDIDGFRDDSHFKSPIWLAIIKVLEYVSGTTLDKKQSLTEWMKTKKFVIVGKGETGGRPTIIELRKVGVEPLIIDSKTSDEDKNCMLKQGDIIVSGVGKNVFRGEDIKQGAILIGIGIRREADGKLYGDYNEAEVEPIAAFYTPTPGGVGPLNLAFLFKNLIEAAKEKKI